MKISVIIPTYKEEASIARLVKYLLSHDPENHVCEILVIDGGSTDNTVKAAEEAGARVFLSDKKGKTIQMNYGALNAMGDILYFLHAESYPPASFAKDIIRAIDNRFQSGCYRLSFDHDHWFLRFNCWFTRVDTEAVRFGDQSLFVTKEAFIQAGGFNESLLVMEDQEVIRRIRRYARFQVFDNVITTSARKYLENGVYKLQGIFFLSYFLYKLGLSQHSLQKIYRFLIGPDKA